MNSRHDGSMLVDRLNRLTRFIDNLRPQVKEAKWPFAIVEIEGKFHSFCVHDGTGLNIVRKLESLLRGLNFLCTLTPNGELLFEEIECEST